MPGFLLEQRRRLHDAIADVFVEPVGGYTFAGRVDRTPPSKLSAPRVFIGDAVGDRRRNGQALTYVAGYPVWVVYDGATRAQVDGVDEIVSRVHDAAVRAGFDVAGHQPSPLPPEYTANAPASLRASLVTVEVSARGLVLCPPPQP